MHEAKATRKVTVANREGVHARAATMIATLARRFRARVELIKGHHRVDATDVLQVLSLGAEEGTQLVLEASGDDAESALDALEALFRNKFDEEHKTDGQ